MEYQQVRKGVFYSRPNRFLAEVELEGQRVWCHVKITGRCRELLWPGVTVWCQHHSNPMRKTADSLIAVEKAGQVVNLDSQAPNVVAAEWLAAGGLGAVPYQLRREVQEGSSRFDFFLQMPEGPIFVEVKGVTLEENGVARFPDAPTERGTRHVQHLARLKKKGIGACVLFVIQMERVQLFQPNWRQDPAFSKALWEADKAGVRVLAVRCQVTPSSMQIAGQVPMKL